MELHGQNDTLTKHALPLDTLLSGKYQLTEVLSENAQWITYIAKESESDTEFHIKEFFPQQAQRSEEGTAIHAADKKVLHKQIRHVLASAKKLVDSKVPYLVCPAACFEENDTIYLVFPVHKSTALEGSDIPMTAMYLRSLAISVCDTYSALHKLGFSYGRISPKEVLLHSDGTFRLSADPVIEAITDEPDHALDLYRLTSFLSDLFLLADSDVESQTQPTPYAVMKNVLQYRYHDAELLKNALISPDNSLDKPRTFISSGKSVVRGFLCVVVLILGAAVILFSGAAKLPLGICMKLGLVRPDVISVWMPLDAAADETETLEMYQKLTRGFERKYPGYGVDLVIYADNSFDDALQFSKSDTEPPTVFMNTRHDTATELADDLTPLIRSLDESYLADMNAFENAIPLGCSLPALYYNAYSCEEIEAETIGLSEIDPEICYDASAAAFIKAVDKDDEYQESDFSVFMDSRSEAPFLASTSCLSVAERNGIASGAIRMLPVSVNGEYLLQYEMNCSVNREKDWNSRYIGMLWLQYLLTEEAQQIMFAENYSILPLHQKVLPQTIENHEALKIVEAITSEFNTTALQ